MKEGLLAIHLLSDRPSNNHIDTHHSKSEGYPFPDAFTTPGHNCHLVG
ncbi:hypothetical protein ES703_75087 [subsurface metagenome]